MCICAENGFCSCLTDKIEEAQKELKDPKAAQKGKRYLTRKYLFYLSFAWQFVCCLIHHLAVKNELNV